MSRMQDLPAQLEPDVSRRRVARAVRPPLRMRVLEMVQPLRTPPAPPRAWVAISMLILLIGTAAQAALMVAGYMHEGWPAYYLQDYMPGTWLSGGCLGLAALVALATALVAVPARSKRFWLLAAATLALAAADDLFRFHERIDLAVHAYFNADPHHPITNHIDNVIVACYGIVALCYIRRRREQILNLPWTAYSLGIAFLLFVGMVILDFADLSMSIEDTLKTYSILFILIGCLAAYLGHKSQQRVS